MALTDTAVRSAKPGTVDRKLADEKGLYLFITVAGSKLWRFKYRFNGKEKKLAFGAYPAVHLKEARARRDAARRQIAEGVDPAQAKRNTRAEAVFGASNSFSILAKEYIAKIELEGRSEVTITKTRWLLGKLSPALGTRPIAEISPRELLVVLKAVEKSGKRETAARLRSFASRVFRYAIATARASTDPAQSLVGALAAPVVKHHAAITDPKALGPLLRAIETYSGQPATKAALRLSPHLFQRPGEVRQMQWAELDLEKAVWTVPQERMKQRKPHHVPLSRQAVEILKDLRELTGRGLYVFPAATSTDRTLSENTLNKALRRMGYSSGDMTAHGFRSTASSLLNESGLWHPDAIERALSHSETNQVRAAYNRSAYWDERVRMAQWWSDYLDGLREDRPAPAGRAAVSAAVNMAELEAQWLAQNKAMLNRRTEVSNG